MNRTLATLASAALLACASNATFAQTRPGAAVRPFVGIGVTGGGDTLESFDFSNGTSSKVRSGGVVDLRAGVDVLLGGPFSAQASIGYHFDSAHGSNGDYEFTRVPLELLGHVALSERWRVGLGVRHAFDTRVSSSGAIAGFDTEFDARTGVVAEAEFFWLPRLGVKLRAVSEKYKATNGTYAGRSYDGSHVGAYLSYYFR